MLTECVIYRLGVIAYEQAWQFQDALAAQIANGDHPPALLLLEHPHTYTFGRRGHAENLLWDEGELQRRGIGVYWVDRGGDVTYHGPGQLVGYPLLPLSPGGLRVDPANGSARIPRADYVGYVRKLETMLISTLMKLGIASGQLEGLTGVWVQPDVLSQRAASPPELGRGPAKIAAIGVKVDARGVSRHGFALNVNPDMAYWQGIVGCGLKDYAVTSLATLLDPPPSMQKVMDAVIQAFGDIFQYKMVEMTTSDDFV